MVRISTFYDTKLKEKVFLVKPAEGYAKTTDTLISFSGSEPILGDYYHYVATFIVNVLRDVDDSFITIYNGDTSLLTVPYTASTDPTSIEVQLSYDEAYNIYAVYEGNKKCLGSTSQPIELFEENPNIIEAVLEFPDGSLQYKYTDGSVDIPIELKYYQEGELVDDDFDAVDVTVYVGKEALDDPVSVVPNGGASIIELTDMEKGAHDIRCVFGGGEIISSASVEQTISHGVKWDISIRDTSLFGVPQVFNIHLSDYIGSTNLDAYFDEGYEGDLWVSPAPQGETREGELDIFLDENYSAIHNFTWQGTGELETSVRFNLDLAGHEHIDVPINLISVSEFGMIVPQSPNFYGDIIDIMGRVSLSNGGSIPDGLEVIGEGYHHETNVRVSDDDYHTIYAWRNYDISGAVDNYLTFSCGGKTATVNVPVYWQYWVLGRPDLPNSRHNSLNYCTLTDLSAGHQIKNSSVYNHGTIEFNILTGPYTSIAYDNERMMMGADNVITTMDFTIVSQTNKAYNTVMDYYMGSVKNGAKIRIQYDRKLEKYTLFINGNEVWNKSNSVGNKFYMHVGKSGHLGEVIIKDVQMRKHLVMEGGD